MSCAQLWLQVGSKLDADDKAKIEETVEEAINWLDANGLAEVIFLTHILQDFPYRATTAKFS